MNTATINTSDRQKLYYQAVYFFLLWFVAASVYINTSHSRFLDYLDNWAFIYDEHGWSGFSGMYQIVSLHYVYHFFTFVLYHYFGFNVWLWTAVFTFLHALNAFLIGKLASVVLIENHNSDKRQILFASIGATFLFLLNPYQTEAVAWGPTIHYLLSCGLLLGALLFFADYTKTGALQSFIATLVLFMLALFTLEIALIFPGIAALWLCYKKVSPFSRKFLGICFSFFILIAVFFLMNRLLLGKWIGHYGAETHLQISLAQLGNAWSKYLAKYLLLMQFFSLGDIKNIVYKTLDTTFAGWVSFFAVIISILSFIFLSGRNNAKPRAWVMFLLMFFIAVVPVFNLYFPSWINIQGDRLGYFASAFFSLFFIFFIMNLKRPVNYIIFSIALCFHIYFLWQNIQSWRSAAIISQSLEEKFKWFDAPHVYILNMPDNFNGANMYRLTGIKPFTKNLEKRHGIDMEGKITDILKYNMQAESDSASVDIIDSTTLQLTLSRWGSWFWRFGQGADNYETEDFKVDIDEWHHSYKVTFYNKKPGAVYLYHAGSEWRKVEGF
jgi:hypothetical protein